MQTIQTTVFERTYKKLIKKRAITKQQFKQTIKEFEEDQNRPTLHFKKIVCKQDKSRYSIRVSNTGYRIIMTLDADTAYLICICDHDDYDRRNRNC